MSESASLAMTRKAAKSGNLVERGASQPKSGKTERQKRRYFRWRGCLADKSTSVRLLVALILTVAGVSFTFTQIGFISFPVGDDEVAYAVVLLQPIALAALLLGTLFGALVGLICGIALLYHSMWMPLDVYEFSFVNPLTSVIMLTATGFVMGLLFAFVLRNDPSSVRRGIYIVIVCVIVSSLYSIGFSVNVFASLINDLTQGLQGGMTEDEAVQIATEGVLTVSMRLGNMEVQGMVDALFMAVLCIGVDVLTRWINARSGAPGVRAVFGTSLFAVMLLTFLVMSAVNYVSITIAELNASSNEMKDEVGYVCSQIEVEGGQADAFESFLKTHGIDYKDLSIDDLTNLIDAISIENVLIGYSEDSDGIVVITVAENNESNAGYSIIASDSERFSNAMKLSDVANGDFIAAMLSSAESGNVERLVYDEGYTSELEILTENGITGLVNVRSQKSVFAYLYSKEADGLMVTMVLPSSKVFKDRDSVMISTSLSFLAVLVVVSILTALLLHRVIIRRIDETNGVLSRITHGDLDARVEVRETREFKSLSDGINDTVVALKGWIAEAETRMDAELATAKAIQESALPRIFPPFPDIMKFDIYAIMHAAKKVGGDFYDFFLIGDDCNADGGKLGFVVADVSGKGVPAALFMMKAKTQIRDYLASGMEPGEAVENANRQLCDGNDGGMFVTAFIGVLDYGTGHIEYVNAGHNPPLLWQKGCWRWLTEKSGLPLGLFDGFPYQAYSLECEVGDQILAYTDGVTEAMDLDGQLYGEERLEKLANDSYPLHPRELIEVVRRSVSMHANGAEQSDDITVLALEVGVPPEITATLTVGASVDELPRVNAFIHTELDRRLCPLRIQNQLDIAVEELFVNVAHYAYPNATPDNPGSVHISYTYSAEPPSITVDIADEGIPYNPLEKPDAVTPDDIADVPIGGLGILMAKRSVDDIRYERVDGSNIVTILKKW